MSQLVRDLDVTLDRRTVLGTLAAGFGGLALGACGSRAEAQAGQGQCLVTPTETRGPYPADGSNRGGRPVNVLNLQGVVRQDIRPSFAGLSGTAAGVPLELELQLARAGGCNPLGGHAIYLWQNDAAGEYSLYTLPEVNYLRGLQAADAQGRVRFTLIIPGCYGGRYPHCHFEVFESIEAAVGGSRPLLVSQLAYPADECRLIYGSDARYGQSLANLEREPIERDFVFADASPEALAQQTITLRGNSRDGFRGMATIALA